MEIIKRLKEYLDENIYSRDNVEEVVCAFKRLEVNVSDTIIEFYKNFAGPFWEESTGFELLDIIDDDLNVESVTLICREEFAFPNKYLALTELTTGEIIVLDSESDKLYKVNFEGGDRALLAGTLKETWTNFDEFLREYFNV